MRTNFYFIRHGQTINNALQLWQGKDTDSILNQQGIFQAQALAEKLDSFYLERLYTSNQQRAMQTAKIISSRCDIPIYVAPELREVDYGVAEGMPIDRVFEQYPTEAHLWYKPDPQHFDNHFEGGESHWDVLKRVFPLLDSINRYQKIKLYDGFNFNEWRIGVISHAGVICSLMAALGVKEPKIDNCEVVHITLDEEGYQYEGKLF